MDSDLSVAISAAGLAALAAGHTLGPWHCLSAHLSVAACQNEDCVFEIRAWDIDAKRAYKFVPCPFTSAGRTRLIEDPMNFGR
jgi:hypothetical protein